MIRNLLLYPIEPWAHIRRILYQNRKKINLFYKDLQKYYETQARTLLTVWGGPVLNDYANRLWGGLLKNYYWHIRWKPFFNEAINAVRNDAPFDEEDFKRRLSEREQTFAYRTWGIRHFLPYKSTVLKKAKEILKSIDNGKLEIDN